jgi:Zn-dependent peptidase ImmA (M78 family)
MNQALRVTLAKRKAEAFLREEGIESLPVDPFAIASSQDIIVKPKPDADAGISGMLLRHGDVFGILYATHIQSEGFQRFSIAHELGHYFLDGHIDYVLPKGSQVHTSHAGFVSGDQYEQEAGQLRGWIANARWPFQACPREM